MPSFKPLIRSITPPILWRGSSYAYHRLSHRLSPSTEVPWDENDARLVEVPNDDPRTIRYLMGDPLFSVPPERLRYHGGIPYVSERHPFLLYYRGGETALREYYERHQPRNVLELHFLEAPPDRDVPDVWVPWEEVPAELFRRGEHGLGSEHGSQAFGPVSEEKLQLEKSRLDAVLNSIGKTGFRPSLGGFPRGYFLVDADGEWVVVVREGFHRVAAMVHLGFSRIPIQFQPRYPRVVLRADCSHWPVVAQGQLTREEALKVFDLYFSPEARGE